MWDWLRKSAKRLFQRFLSWFRPNRSSTQASGRHSTNAPSHIQITNALSRQPEVHPASMPVADGSDLLSQIALLPLSVIAGFLDVRSVFLLSKCGRYLRDKLAPERLSYYVVYDHLINAGKMLDNNPSLLIGREVTVTTRTGRVLKDITPLKGALRERGDRMAAMIKGYFINNGWLDKFNTQYDAVFPDGVTDEEGFDFSEIVAAITQAGATPADIKAQLANQQNGSALCAAFNDFREAFTKQNMAEAVVNPNHLLHSWDTYRVNWSNWSFDQCDLYLNQVFGYSQRLLPANMAKDVSQGVYYIQEKNEPRRVSSDVSLREDSAAGGVCVTLHLGAGFLFWVDIFGLGVSRGGMLRGVGAPGASRALAALQNLFRAHTSVLQNLSSGIDHHARRIER